EVSNREFYDCDLVLPPSPLQKDPAYGLCFTRADGVYDKGGKRDNRKEGESIVDRVAEQARAKPSHSLGIVTFSFAQGNLITELLELRRRRSAYSVDGNEDRTRQNPDQVEVRKGPSPSCEAACVRWHRPGDEPSIDSSNELENSLWSFIKFATSSRS